MPTLLNTEYQHLTFLWEKQELHLVYMNQTTIKNEKAI